MTIARHSIAVACSALAAFGLLGACGSAQTYQLSVSGAQAPGYFGAIKACAGQASLSTSDAMNGVFVDVDAGTQLQFLVQGASFNLVVWVKDSVPEGERPQRTTAGKSKADELMACAIKLGPTEVAAAPADPAAPTDPVAPTDPAAPTDPTAPPLPVPPGTTTAPSKPGPAPTMKIATLGPEACAKPTKRCNSLSDCAALNGEHCTDGLCWPNKNGCRCDDDSGCPMPGSHCGKGLCYPDKEGAPCEEADGAGECGGLSGLHCAAGLCYPNKTGAPCSSISECGLSSSCVDGVCN